VTIDPVGAAPDDLSGVRAVVTGGTRGIGGATVRRLAAAGANVVAIARHQAPTPGGSRLVVADLATQDGATRAAERALESLGGVDVLVGNAGRNTHVPGGVLAATDEDWQLNLEANLMSVVRVDRVLVPAMVAQGHGAVVHVSSAATRSVPANGVPYAAAKAALNAYSKALANAVGPHGVRVNVVMPTVVATDLFEQTMLRYAQESGRDAAVVRQEFIGRLGAPLGRAGTVEEAAELIAFLASPRSSYLTGIQVPLDGGALPML
jgi:NAD(P)-dependent dehydrogenase (short-subunit alcohol dehydrogenase family)